MVSRRSLAGAWIEIVKKLLAIGKKEVAPLRERGLKLSIIRRGPHALHVAPLRERGLKLDSQRAVGRA